MFVMIVGDWTVGDYPKMGCLNDLWCLGTMNFHDAAFSWVLLKQGCIMIDSSEMSPGVLNLMVLLLLVGFWIFSHSTRILLEWGNYLFQISAKILSPHMIFGVWTSFFLIMGVRMTIGTLPAILLCCVFFYSLRRGFQESAKVLTFQNARSQANNSASSTSQNQSKFVYVWEFLERDNRWLPFVEDQQVQLEDAYCRKDSELRLPPRDGQKGHRWGRVVSFAEMTQRNEETGKVRNVRRRRELKMIDDRLKQFPPGAMFPLNTLSRAASLERGELLRSQPDFDTLVRIFQESMTRHRKSLDSDEWCPKPMVEVIKIEEVVNPLKQRLYEVAQDEVGSRNPSGCGRVPGISAPKYHPPMGHVDKNEHFLFHGTNYDNVCQIIEHGLDPQRGGSASARFGYGTYFAENASKSDFYTTCDQCAARPSGVGKCHHPTGMRCMIVAQVLLGKTCAVTEADRNRMRACDRKDGRGPYDSHTALKRADGGCVDHMEYIIFKEQRALVRFLIFYKHKEKCQCKDCLFRRGDMT